MTTPDIEQLRKLVEATVLFGQSASPWADYMQVYDAFRNAANPQTILGLITRLEEAENARDTNFSTCADLERQVAFLTAANKTLQDHMGKTRTPGTVEVCRHHRSVSCGDNEDYPNMGVCGRSNCPRKAIRSATPFPTDTGEGT